jgi:uncharacterized cupredoxin-like copper-binding protein
MDASRFGKRRTRLSLFPLYISMLGLLFNVVHLAAKLQLPKIRFRVKIDDLTKLNNHQHKPNQMKKQSPLLAKLASAILLAGIGMAAPSALAHGDAHKKDRSAAMSIDEHEFGKEGDAKKVTRTMNVYMHDSMRFSPDTITVKQGETIKFIVHNKGKILHEMVVGTMDALKAHSDLMKKMPGMEHDEPYMVHVQPGEKAEMVWQFTKFGDFNFGCLVPGHFESGMIGSIKVTRG